MKAHTWASIVVAAVVALCLAFFSLVVVLSSEPEREVPAPLPAPRPTACLIRDGVQCLWVSVDRKPEDPRCLWVHGTCEVRP